MASFTALAEEALEHAKALDAYLESRDMPFTSFKHDSLTGLPSDLTYRREGLINVAQTLKQLAQGPSGVLTELTWACADEISLGAIYDYQLARHVPLDGSTSFADIAEASGLSANLVERLLRHAMANRIFTEDLLGQVEHTANSRQLATDPDLNDAIGVQLRETWRVAGKAHEAIAKFCGSEEPGDTAFGLVNEPGVSMFEYLSRHPERARRFGGAMRYYGKFEGWDLKHLVQGYDWTSLDLPGSTFVDVGGGQGSVACALAEATTRMRFVVQDLEGTVQDGQKSLPEILRGRVSFMEHDFFTEQPIKGAEVYFFRWILHDWSDKYALRILQSLVPAMRDGARVILYEWLLADGPETRWTEKQAR